MSVSDYDTLIPFADDMAFTFKITSNQINRIPDEKGVLQPKFSFDVFEGETCDQQKHVRNAALSDVLKTIDLKQFKCFPIDKHDFKFGGSFDLSPESYILTVEIIRCDPTTKICHDEKTIDSILERLSFNMYFPLINFDPQLADPIV
jgi:hypothetical protein